MFFDGFLNNGPKVSVIPDMLKDLPRLLASFHRIEPVTILRLTGQTGSVTPDIRTQMNATARAAWSAIADGDDFGLRLREDTVTEGVLLHLTRRFPGLLLYRFNQTAEKLSGGDWEWFVGSRNQGWVAFRIQAKRMDDLRYRQLDHEGLLPGERQYDTLIRDSVAAPVPTFPFHVFFSGWSGGWPASVAWNACPSGYAFPQCKHHEETDMGCALLPSTAVRILHRNTGTKRLHVATYLPHSVPWSWLFGPPDKSGAARRQGLSSVSQLVAWHEAMAAFLAGTHVPEHPTGSAGDGSRPGDLVRWWANAMQQDSAIPEREPGHDLPEYAAWALQRAITRRRSRDRLEPEATPAWDPGSSRDFGGQPDDALPTFASPSGVDGLLFTPWP